MGFDDVLAVNFARSGGSNRSFDIEIKTRGDTIYTFSSIEKDEYSRLYEFLKSKKITVKSTGKMDASKLDLSSDNIDHYAETVKADAVSSEGSDNSMSSDDEDFNPDTLEAKDAKEEYDSDPSDTGSESDEGSGSGSEGEKSKRRKEKAEKKAAKAARKKSSAPSNRQSKPKKKTLPGQPKKPMSAYFLWLNEEGRELIKKENPGASVTEVAKTAGTKWGAIDESTKKKYEEMHKDLKEKPLVAVRKRRKVKVLGYLQEEVVLVFKARSSLRIVIQRKVVVVVVVTKIPVIRLIMRENLSSLL